VSFAEVTLPAWRAAGFQGSPDWRIVFRRGTDVAAVVCLSRDQPGALIELARPSAGAHWLDMQDFELGPQSKRQTYGRVDAAGRFELRTLP
jgi:hypothetical protein